MSIARQLLFLYYQNQEFLLLIHCTNTFISFYIHKSDLPKNLQPRKNADHRLRQPNGPLLLLAHPRPPSFSRDRTPQTDPHRANHQCSHRHRGCCWQRQYSSTPRRSAARIHMPRKPRRLSGVLHLRRSRRGSWGRRCHHRRSAVEWSNGVQWSLSGKCLSDVQPGDEKTWNLLQAALVIWEMIVWGACSRTWWCLRPMEWMCRSRRQKHGGVWIF